METPSIKIKSSNCPCCGETVGIKNYYSGPQTVNGEKYQCNIAYLICTSCGKKWRMQFLVNIQ